ncbi:MAG: hypothetical protein ACHQ0J_13470 [Candidatus Dormibacterales bacterium]
MTAKPPALCVTCFFPISGDAHVGTLLEILNQAVRLHVEPVHQLRDPVGADLGHGEALETPPAPEKVK